MKILYHDKCSDGFCAAWIAHTVFGETAEYIPVQYSTPAPDVGEEDVLIVDFCFKRPELEKMLAKGAKLIIIDHHKTVPHDLDGLTHPKLTVVFDRTKSGARLTQEYLHRASNWLIDYTEDYDLWKFKLSSSREVSAAILSYPYSFKQWDYWLNSAPAESLDQLKIDGTAIVRYQRQRLDKAVENARMVVVEGWEVPCLNATMLVNEIGEKLCQGHPFSLTWFQRQDGKFIYSLRSDPNGEDVSEIAKVFGGGGHAHAAGFELDYLINRALTA